jgi:MerR family transcriptional regulator, light-induced transcriptional regulator
MNTISNSNANPNPAQDTPLFTASEVEHRTSVPATTLRQWERRYGLPNPKRTPGGYRLYSQNDIACIEFFKNRISAGIPASRAAQLYALEQSLPAGNDQLHEHIQHLRAVNTNSLMNQLIEAILVGDNAKADTVLAQAHHILAVESVLLELIQPTMVEIGERWHRGEITIAHEHQATAYLRGKLHGLLEMAGSPRHGPTVVVACAPGEWHEIGALTIAIFLRRAGIRTHFLGANTPIVDLARFAREIKASAVMVSAGTSDVIENMRHQVHLLREAVPIVIYGGNGFNDNPSLAQELGGEFFGDNAKVALESLLSRFVS